VLRENAPPPDSWKEAVISVIFKDGDPQLPNNYRPISMIPLLCKLFSRLVLKRIRQTLDAQQSVDQAGFRSGFSTDDHLFALTQLQEKAFEWQQDIWIAAVDFKKAFDTIIHETLWNALWTQGVPQRCIYILIQLYRDASATVKLDCMSKRFSLKRGVRQGDPASPQLFNAVLESIFRKLKSKWAAGGFGIKIDDGESLTNLRFADDVLLVASSLQEVRAMLADLAEEAASCGLELHPGKTKILSNKRQRSGMETATQVPVAGMSIDILPFAEKTKYLGRQISFCRPHVTEIENRIKSAWGKFFAHKGVLCNKSYSLKQRLRLFSSVITPAVLYGSGSWVLTHDTASLLKKTQRRMLRTMFQKGRRPQTNIGSDDQSSTSEQGSQTLEPDQAEEILEPWVDWIRRVTHEIEGYASAAAVEDWVLAHRRRLFTWAGHVSRRGDNRWTTRLLDWTPSGRTRQQGRPCLRWEDPVNHYFQECCGLQSGEWRLLAANQNEWRSHIDKFVSHRPFF
jgi:hypothetical protein